MNFTEYKERALRTESILPPDHLFLKQRLIDLFKAIAELGNAVDLMKKAIFYKKDIRDVDIYICIKKARQHLDEVTQWLVTPAEEFEATSVDLRLVHALIGFVGESGELAARAAKILEQDTVTDSDRLNFLEEFGDSGWYEAIGFDSLGFTREQRDERNIAKLEARYGGSFSVEKCENRNLAAERAALRGEDNNGNDTLGEDQ